MISTSKCFIEPVLAQASIKPQEASSSSASATAPDSQAFGQAWMYVSIVLILIMLGLLVYGKIKFDEMGKKLKFEQYKTTDLQKKLKLALNTIRKMEGNPDL